VRSRPIGLGCVPALIVSLVLLASPSQADTTPAPTYGFVAGASVFLAGFVVGGVIVATSNYSDSQTNAGWLTMDAGFALAPFASHAFTGEWTRALWFSGVPSACFAASATLVAVHPATILHGTLEDQRAIWSVFGGGLLSGLVGVVDSAFVARRAKRSLALTPLPGPGQIGLGIGAQL
jgi:hypothetical protein